MTPDKLDAPNTFMASGNGKTLSVLRPVIDATPDQVLLHAAWLVTMAEPFAEHSFEDYRTAVRST